MPFLEDLFTLIEDGSVGTRNVNLFATTSANIPILASGAATINIVETPGESAQRTHNSVITPAYLVPMAQVTVRAGKSKDARDTATDVAAALEFRNGYINSGWYQEITSRQPPFDLGVDDRGQARYAFNVRAIKRP
jgi:hypothetical protein